MLDLFLDGSVIDSLGQIAELRYPRVEVFFVVLDPARIEDVLRLRLIGVGFASGEFCQCIVFFFRSFVRL